MQRIVIIDYHMGNLRSVCKALEHVSDDGTEVIVSSDAATIRAADKVVFPGQGAARDCMAEIHRLDLAQCIREVLDDRPFLGICMGLQVLLEVSEESPQSPCLGAIAGRVRRLPARDAAGHPITIPQMGWNQVWRAAQHPLWHGIADGERSYFMNSYYADPDDPKLVMARTPYGLNFACALGNDHMFAVQFHPEKSQHAGLGLLANFTRWDGQI